MFHNKKKVLSFFNRFQGADLWCIQIPPPSYTSLPHFCYTPTRDPWDDQQIHDWPHKNPCKTVSFLEIKYNYFESWYLSVWFYLLPTEGFVAESCVTQFRMHFTSGLICTSISEYSTFIFAVMSWHLRASSSSLWLLRERSGNLILSVIFMTHWP